MFKRITSLQKRFNIRTSLQVTLSVLRRVLLKEKLLRLLRTNSVKEIFELRKLEFLTRLLERGYPREFAENILAKVKFSSRDEALQNKTKTSRNVLPFITTFNPATPNLKKVFMKHWHLITESNRLGQIYSEPPIVAYRKDKWTSWLELKFLRTFNNNILEFLAVRAK